ncbi:MAG: DUF3300 domain-containing protein, partial [Acidobacteria bacterium]|nr:DUF3300 domain-containing protein [Acidobacteriota bacterium]
MDPNVQDSAPLLSPEQLDNLVAPVALYPDPLLSQVLSASTYPLEIVEAQQWLSQNGNLRGEQLTAAAQQQNWDASVQALVTVPDVLRVLSSNIRWTTDLGNAFLAQQDDVMNAVQRMRARAQANGRLSSNSQQVVTSQLDAGYTAIAIEPADPMVMYVPVYDPYYVWGAPSWGYYPSVYAFGISFGYRPCYVGSYYHGWGGWRDWGWGLGWSNRSVFVNTGFFSRYGYRNHYSGPRYSG